MSDCLCSKSSPLRFKHLCLTTFSKHLWNLVMTPMYFCWHAMQIPLIKSLGISRNSWHYQWREKLYQRKKPAGKMTPTALIWKMIVLLSKLQYYLKILYGLSWGILHIYLWVTEGTIKFLNRITKLNYELNNSNEISRWVAVKSHC